MVSDGNQFRIYVPPKNKFILGRTDQEIKGQKDVPINLRPQHIFQALIIDPVTNDRGANTRVLDEEQEGKHKYYVLSLIGPAKDGVGALLRKIWVDRFDLRLVRQKLYEGGRLVSDINYRDFKDFEGGDYPSVIDFTRPQEDYSLRIRISKAVTNEPLRDEQFVLEQPGGTELLDLAKDLQTVR
jgi:outer membrane lipoprotein-sorting protein